MYNAERESLLHHLSAQTLQYDISRYYSQKQKQKAKAKAKSKKQKAKMKDTAQAQLSSAEHQLQIIKEELLVRAKKIEEFEVWLAAELAKATSEAERVKADAQAVVAVYRADAEVAHARAKEIFDAAQVRSFCVAEHAKCQSRRETLEDIYASGFDLTGDIENAKVLEAEAKALLSDDDGSGSSSGSKSGWDEDEAPGED
ncbi:uncharacterized protein [Nicotiana sylvestris]|uniref:uncharacterized protein n=1 Tax=Nicotiana sylvestris TaxID=4096 RepID=UPI00388C671B